MTNPPSQLEILKALDSAQLSVPSQRDCDVLGWLWAQHAFPRERTTDRAPEDGATAVKSWLARYWSAP